MTFQGEIDSRRFRYSTSFGTLMGCFAICGALLGCSSGDWIPARGAEKGTEARVVENAAPAGASGQGLQIVTIPEVTIGAQSGTDADARGEPMFHRVQTRFLPDGRIVVADGSSSEVMVFDTAGMLVSRFGGQGQGPGELQSIAAVHVCGGGSIAVVDSRRTLHFFDQDGTFTRRVRPRLGGRSALLRGISRDCRRALLQQRTRMPRLNRLGLSEDVFAWADLSSEAVDTVTTAELLEAWTRNFQGGMRPWVIPWGASGNTNATRHDRLVLGNGRYPELRGYDSTGGLQWIVRWPGEPRPITAGDQRRYSTARQEFLLRVPSDHPEARFLFPALDDYPEVPTHKPLFDRLLVDDQGGIWVRLHPQDSFGLFDLRLPEPMFFTETWTVFDSAGIWLGDLTLPDRFELHDIGRDQLLGVARDSWDTETVQVLQIEAVPGW